MVLVFIHGAGSNSDFWREQEPAFPDAHFPNLPGHTAARDTSRGEGKQSIEEYADWVERYVNIAKLGGVVLVGHSMGGAIALSLALRHPTWLSALVLTNTGARLSVLPELLDALRKDYPAAVDMIVDLGFAPQQEPLTYKQRLRRNGIRRTLLRTPQPVTLGDYEAATHFDVTRQLGEIHIPTLCIAGAEDRLVPSLYSEHLHSGLKNSQLKIIEGAGHMLPLEKPAEYNSAVEQFASSVRR